ncbi:MAG: 30S ribosomal protein S12 methylthiotransferase RimO [Acidaminococcaceae bacterium]
MKIGLVSLGCPKNLVDSETMLGIIEDKHLTITNNPEEADIIIVNTCGFIESAKEESINTVLQMAEYKNEGNCKHLILAGCLGQRYSEELLADIPEVDAIVGTECYTEIGKVIDRILKGERFICLQPEQSTDNTTGMMPRILTTPNYSAYLKIAEGCDNCCSYCIIPKLRGPYRSRPFEEVLAEANALVNSGVKELILVAQDTPRYGEDLYDSLRLPELLKELNNIEGLKWIRILYCYPQYFTEELIEAIANYDKVCKYVDIPLQHISDAILTRMNRPDSKEQIVGLLVKLRKRIPDICIRTTFIVGFPGETAADFEELKEFVAEQKFDCAGVFAYSQEEGTAAALMADQTAESLKQDRYHELMAIQAKVSEEIHMNIEEKVLDVLVEGFDEENKNLACGRSYREAPEIDGTIYIEDASKIKVGEFVKVRIVQGFTYELVGELA